MARPCTPEATRKRSEKSTAQVPGRGPFAKPQAQVRASNTALRVAFTRMHDGGCSVTCDTYVSLGRESSQQQQNRRHGRATDDLGAPQQVEAHRQLRLQRERRDAACDAARAGDDSQRRVCAACRFNAPTKGHELAVALDVGDHVKQLLRRVLHNPALCVGLGERMRDAARGKPATPGQV